VCIFAGIDATENKGQREDAVCLEDQVYYVRILVEFSQNRIFYFIFSLNSPCIFIILDINQKNAQIYKGAN
jgi:hypothetical protein